jgi:hypothetical protein
VEVSKVGANFPYISINEGGTSCRLHLFGFYVLNKTYIAIAFLKPKMATPFLALVY